MLQVYAVDSRTLFIKDFSYDGTGPDAYFYAGESGRPSGEGFLIPNERGSKEILKVKYRGVKHIFLINTASYSLQNYNR